MTSGRKELSIGDSDIGIGNTDLDKRIIKHLQGITMRTQSPEKCMTCPISTGCGVCVGYQYDVFGDPNIRATYICEIHQVRTMLAYYFHKKILKQMDKTDDRELLIPRDWALNIISEEEYEMLLSLGGDTDGLSKV